MALWTLSTAITLILARSARLDYQVQMVDCSDRKPPPEPEVSFETEWLHEEKEGSEKPYLKAMIDVGQDDQCNYFIYDHNYQRFVPLKLQHAFKETANGMEKESFCSVSRFGDPEFCEVKKGNKVWKYATEWTNDSCMKKLCRIASTGEWRRAKWFQEQKQRSAKKMPWQSHVPGGVGYEDAFDWWCWRGPEGFGDLLGSFKDFADKNGLINPTGSFNKTVCGCPTEDEC